MQGQLLRSDQFAKGAPDPAMRGRGRVAVAKGVARVHRKRRLQRREVRDVVRDGVRDVVWAVVVGLLKGVLQLLKLSPLRRRTLHAWRMQTVHRRLTGLRRESSRLQVHLSFRQAHFRARARRSGLR